jgi:hypothetical protein
MPVVGNPVSAAMRARTRCRITPVSASSNSAALLVRVPPYRACPVAGSSMLARLSIRAAARNQPVADVRREETFRDADARSRVRKAKFRGQQPGPDIGLAS